jgi:ABC-2 type transport system permease protein
MGTLTQIATVVALDALVMALLVLALVPLAKWKPAAFAVMKRNFVSYFSTPTGYVFVFVFVLLTLVATFWPHDFFNSNMATLHQLNLWFPYIMLVFIPAVTMSIWAEERRQGTDELLLTIPAGDFDIVLGKYLAAALIFTASLLYSQLSIFGWLSLFALGEVDLGLFFANYLGFWFMGLAMLAIGMVASFLTSNLTVGFILGALFNAPLAFAANVDVIIPWTFLSQAVRRWSFAAQLDDFGRGVASLSSMVYFFMIVAVGLFLSMVLIGRRHWLGGRDGHSMLGHYVLRSLALIAIAIASGVFFTHHDWIRYDATSEQISSLSAATLDRIAEIKTERPIYIEAFLSKTLPEQYVKTKFDMISLLREIKARGGDKIVVNIHENMEPFVEEAKQAEERYGIRPMTIATFEHGSFKQEEVFLAVAFNCGLERVVIPFFGHGTPIEYELVRSLSTVAEAGRPSDTKTAQNSEKKDEPAAATRKTIGVLRTDAQLTGGLDMATFRSIPPQAIIDELRKQYNVEDVDPNGPIEFDPALPPEKRKYHVLLVVQPSSLTQPQLDNLIDAVQRGQPAAIFEDPAPVRLVNAPGTDFPKRPRGGMMGMGQPPEQKGDISQLWNLLGVNMVRAKKGELQPETRLTATSAATRNVNWSPLTAIVWQHYNPYPKDRSMPDAVVFANPNAPGSENVFNPKEPAVSGLQEVAFLVPGAFEAKSVKSPTAKTLEVIPLIMTGPDTGIMTIDQLNEPGKIELLKEMDPDDSSREETTTATRDQENIVSDGRLRTEKQYMLAARIRTREETDSKKATKESGKDGDAKDDSAAPNKAQPKIDVIVVGDIDLMESLFVNIRSQPSGGGVSYNFQNITFVLNVLDVLAGDMRFVDIRKRQRRYATLKLIEYRIQEAEGQMKAAKENYEEKVNKTRQEAKDSQQKVIDQLRAELAAAQKDGQSNERDVREAQQKLDWRLERDQRSSVAEEERHVRNLQSKVREISRDLDLTRLSIQNWFKFWAVSLSPIPLLIVALVVFVGRRLREREGVSKARLR